MYVAVLLCLMLADGAVNDQFPAKITSNCVQYDPLQDPHLTEALGEVKLQLGSLGCNPPKNRTCQEILSCFPSAPSGYYQIRVPNC